MDVPQNVIDALNEQMQDDYSYSLFFRAMCDGLHVAGWRGFYRFMHNQSHDFRHYAHQIARYLVKRGVNPTWGSIAFDAPPSGNDPVNCFKYYLDVQLEYADKINALYNLSESAGDNQTCEFLDAFLDDVTDNVAKARYKFLKVSRVANDMHALEWLDHEFKEKRK